MEADCGHGLSLFKENCSECWREERDALQARVKELEESIKLYRGAIVESGDLKRENAKLRKVVDAARALTECGCMFGSPHILQEALRELDATAQQNNVSEDKNGK